MSALRKSIFWITLCFLLLTVYQNCSPTRFSHSDQLSTSKSVIASNSGTGNGAGYDGKLTVGQYFRINPESSCGGGSTDFYGQIEIGADSAQLTRDACASVDVAYATADNRIYQSQYYRDLLAVDDTVYEKSINEVKPSEVITTWCSLTNANGFNHDLVIKSNVAQTEYKAIIVATKRDVSSGTVTEIRSQEVGVSKVVNGSAVSFISSAYALQLDLDTTSLNKFRMAAQFRASIDFGDINENIACIYHSSKSTVPAPAQLVGFWNFEDVAAVANLTDGTIVLDSSANANSGTVVNPDGNGMAVVAGKFGRGLSLDGKDDYINISSIASKITTEFSLSIWFQTTYSMDKNYLIAANPNMTGNMFKLGFGTCSSTLSIDELAIELDNSTCFWSGVKPIDVIWHHTAVTVTASNTVFYLDGQIKAQGLAPFVFDATTAWVIGQEFDTGPKPTDFYQGNLDEVMIWNKALGELDIKHLYDER
jgi:hypothetical protein